MRYEDMVIEAFEASLDRTDKHWQAGFKVRVYDSPVGGMEVEDAIPVTYPSRDLQAKLGQLENRQLDRAGLIELGRTLAAMLLPPEKAQGAIRSARDFLVSSLDKIGPDCGLRLRLDLPPLLDALPWEFMYVDRAGGGGGMDGFMALDPRVAIVRHEKLPIPADLAPLSGDIKVVVALASGAGLPLLDLEKEKGHLEDTLAQSGLKPTFLEDATLDDVMAAIPGTGAFHFAGHGRFNWQMGDMPGTYSGSGALALFDQDVDAERLGQSLQGEGVRLAVLGGCETGRRDGISVWSGVAPALVKRNVPAVVANQYKIEDDCAIAFSRHFYLALVGGLGIEHAVARGRIAAYNARPEDRDWGVPVLYLRAKDGHLFEGAADAAVRQKARADAELEVDLRLREVAAGGKVLGADVGQLLDGKLSVQVKVAETVLGQVTVAELDHLGPGGRAEISAEVDRVGPSGELVGAKVDVLGGAPRGPTCPKCHAPVEDDWNICAFCGTEL